MHPSNPWLEEFCHELFEFEFQNDFKICWKNSCNTKVRYNKLIDWLSM